MMEFLDYVLLFHKWVYITVPIIIILFIYYIIKNMK